MGLTAVAVVYTVFDPAVQTGFPSCPFHAFTGWQCAGCGSQRALHQLLHGHVAAAFAHNPLLVSALPYLLIGLILDRIKHGHHTLEKCRRLLYGSRAGIVVLMTIIGFWVLRNVF